MDGIIRKLGRKDKLQQVVNLGQAMEIDGENVTVGIATLELSFLRLKDKVMDEAVNGSEPTLDWESFKRYEATKPTKAEFYANKKNSQEI